MRNPRKAYRLWHLYCPLLDEITGIKWCKAGGYDPYNHAGVKMMPRDKHGRITWQAAFNAFASKSLAT